jgi:hypothetical protein
VSTIKVDTIQTRSGVSEIGIDKLKGASSASSISVVGEGGTTTTNLQQGLAKAWVGSLDSDAVAVDSFAFSGFTDNGSGDNTCTFTNNMANIGYSSVATIDIAGAVANRLAVVYVKSTSLFKVESFIADTAGNSGSDQNCTVLGDLA